jgi:hypothetical protein
MTILLAQAVSSAFLIDPVKPVLLLVPALVGAALTSRLTKDIRFCGLPSEKWHATMIGGTLLAPCLPNQDLVIAHAGMVFSAKTLSTGALFFSLPALKTDGQVDIRFSGGETASAAVPMPDAAAVQRVAVQWPFLDGFVIHAFEDGAAFGAQGHIWQETPNLPEAGAPAKGGYVQLLGDGGAAMPLMAQVFTYDAATPTEVLFEAAVTETNCAGEMMGDVLFAKGGAVEKSEISGAMPACDALGEYVHLGFTPPSPALALANETAASHPNWCG